MEFQQLTVSVRNRTGKGPARRLRGRGLAPAVLYGTNMDSISLAVSPQDLVKALSGPLRMNTVISLKIDGAKKKSVSEFKVIVTDHQYDPVSRELLHVDFVAVDLKQKMKLKIPLLATGRSIGVLAGGVMTIVYRMLPVECFPADIPESVTIDVTTMDINDSLPAEKIEMPENVTILLSPETTVAMVQAAKVEAEPETEEGEEGEEGEGEGEGEGEEGAKKEGEAGKDGEPAKDGKKPAPEDKSK